MSGARWLREGYECHQAGDLMAAAQLYRRAARDGRVKADAMHGLGLIDLQSGQIDAAIESLSRAAKLAPRNASILNSFAHGLMAQQRFGEASDVLRRSVAIAPQPDTYFNLAYADQGAGRPFEAEAGYREALKLAPDHAGALNNLAGLLHSLGRITESVAVYRQAVAQSPDDPEVRLNLARAQEIAGDLDAALDTIGLPQRSGSQDPRPALLRARILRRQGDDRAAVELLGPLLEVDLSDDLGCTIRKELALCLDKQGDYPAAFAMATAGNRLRKRQAGQQGLEGRAWLARVDGYRSLFSAETLERAVDGGEPARQPPIFFVGFPRSGTTLMETILATHPHLVTSGEITPLDHVLAAMAPSGHPDEIIAAIGSLNEQKLDALRTVFWDAATALFPALRDGQRLVDKAPFNLVELGLINLLFPAAPVLVARRDPRDVCLSCYFQDFALSDAVVNFLDIADTAHAYACVDRLWGHYREVLSMPWLEYRYEELVADTSGVAARVFEFLGLPWQPELLQQRGRPAAGQFIATPSRDAVSQPITASAVRRWQRYRQELAPALDILQPVVQSVGYNPD